VFAMTLLRGARPQRRRGGARGHRGGRGGGGRQQDDRQGRAVQVEPIKPTLRAPGTKRLKLQYYEMLSRFPFKFNLRRYNKERAAKKAKAKQETVKGVETPGVASDDLVETVQVDPIKPTLKAPGIKLCIKLTCDKPLSNFAFKFNLRRYKLAESGGADKIGGVVDLDAEVPNAVTAWEHQVGRCRLTLSHPR